jgi:hypothetical protein
MTGEEFYINYSQNGKHYSIGPYHTRRFAMSHIEDVRRQPGVSNVYLGNKPPDDKSYRKRVPNAPRASPASLVETHHQRRMTEAKSVSLRAWLSRASILRCGCLDRT